MSPRKSGHWASLQQAMNPVQNQEESNQTVSVEEDNANPSAENLTTPAQDDFDIPRDAFSLFSDEEDDNSVRKTENVLEDSNDELLLGETEDPPAKESEFKWNAVEIKGNDPVEKNLDDDFEIPTNAFELFSDEEPKTVKKKKSKKQSVKEDAAPVAQSETPSEPKSEQPESVRKPRKAKKVKSAPTEETESAVEVSAVIPEDQILESIATSSMDDSVIHTAATQTPVYFPVHQIEVAPVSLDQPESEATDDSTPSSTSLLDDLIPDSAIDRVNQKAAKKEKKNAKKAAKSAPVEEKPVALESKILDDDFDIPADAFSMFDDEDEQPKPKAKKTAKKEKPVKAEKPVVEPEIEEDFDIPADAFSMFDDEEEPAKAPKAKQEKPEKVEKREKKSEKKEKKFEKRAKKEERFEEVNDEFDDHAFEEVDDEYEERPRRQSKQKPARERRVAEEPAQTRESKPAPEVREGEAPRKTINIPSWREVMDTLVEMNMDRRKASERPSRQERRSRSAVERQREIEDIEDRFEREDVEKAPRRRRRRPE